MGALAAVVVADGPDGWPAVLDDAARVAATLGQHPMVDAALITGPRAGTVDGRDVVVSAGPSGLAARIDADVVLLHDASSPPPPAAVVGAVLKALAGEAAAGAPAVLPATLMPDTVKVIDADGVVVGGEDRDRLRVWQWPWGVRREWLAHAPGDWRDWLAGARIPDGAVVVPGRGLAGPVAASGEAAGRGARPAAR